MKKLIGLLTAASFIAVSTAAQATELNPDPNFASPGSWMTGTGWSVSGGAAHGTAATSMKMLEMTGISGIKQGHRYKVVYTVANSTGGATRAFVGLTMSSGASAPYVSCCIADIADNFTYSNGITSPVSAPASSDPWGAFRMICASDYFAPDDPEVLPGQPNASHMHQFFGNTGVNGNSTYNSLKTTGGTTCGNASSQTSPLNRSAYWFPAMTDGANIIRPSFIQLYYKTMGSYSSTCGAPPDSTHVGYCVNLPNGIRFLHGYNFSNGQGGPADHVNPVGNPDHNNIYWQCWASLDNSATINGASPPFGPDTHFDTIKAVHDAGCPAGAQLVAILISPECWDGNYLDTPDHRAHVVRATGPYVTAAGKAACTSDHPYMIPDVQLQLHWTTDANFVAGKWHLTSDEMVHGAIAGTTLHQDYFEAWSRAAKNTWYTNCINNHLSCAGGALGDGTGIAGGDNTVDGGNASATPPFRSVPTDTQGLGRSNAGNGTYTEEITAPRDAAQTFGIMAIDDSSGTAFTGDITSLSVTDLGPVAKGPVTVHNP